MSSPQRRAAQTAAVVAHRRGRPSFLADADADFEEWRNQEGTVGGDEFAAL